MVEALARAGARIGRASRLASRAMAARIIDGKAIAQAVRAEVKRDVADFVAQGNLAPGLATVLVGDDPALRRLRRQQAEGVGRGRDRRASTTGCPRTPPTRRSRRCCASSPAPSACPGSCSSSRRRGRSTAPALTALIPPGKDVDGLTPLSAGLLAQGRPGLRPCTPVGRDGAAAPPRGPAAGRRGGRGRALGPRRAPARGAAAGRQRHRDRLPLAHPRPRRGLPPRRRARRRRRPPAHDPGRLGQAGRDGDRRRHQPHRRRARRRRRLRDRRRARRADHAGPGRRRADDDRDAAAQHAAGGQGRAAATRRWRRARRGTEPAPPGRADRRRRRRRAARRDVPRLVRGRRQRRVPGAGHRDLARLQRLGGVQHHGPDPRADGAVRDRASRSSPRAAAAPRCRSPRA